MARDPMAEIRAGVQAMWNRSYDEEVAMPLVKSKSDKAVGQNIKAETEAGKPRRQAIAIALDVQRRAKGKKRKGK